MSAVVIPFAPRDVAGDWRRYLAVLAAYWWDQAAADDVVGAYRAYAAHVIRDEAVLMVYVELRRASLGWSSAGRNGAA